MTVALTSCWFGSVACGEDAPAPESWQVVQEDLPGALLSVWGSSSADVWVVGADARDGTGPLVGHFDGQGWERVDTGLNQGTLWWVHGFSGGPLFMGGEGGLVLRYEDGDFTVMDTPDTGTVFGLWGSTPEDMWAVGGASESGGGFAWRLRGEVWQAEATLPEDITENAAIWKMAGISAEDAWLVGSNGVSLHWDGEALSEGDTGVGSSLFTVHARGGRYVAVGGLASGIIVERDAEEWVMASADPVPPGLAGVFLDQNGGGVAVGTLGAVYSRGEGGWTQVEHGLPVNQNLHATWIDEAGGVWAVGGQTFSDPLTDGVLIHRGEAVPEGGL